MQSLRQLRIEQYSLMQELLNNGGEITGSEDVLLEELQNKIKAKTDSYVGLVVKDGFFDSEIDRTKKFIEAAKDYIESISKSKARIESVLHEIARQEGYLEYRVDDDAPPVYVKPFMKQKSHVEIEKVTSDEGSYTLPKLKAEEYNKLVDILTNTAPEMAKLIVSQSGHSCNVSDLPEGHPAISVELTPSIKIVKTKPKD